MKAENSSQPQLTPEEIVDMQKKSQQEKITIPPQYANMPSELVEEMLAGGATLADPEKQKAELERREKIVEAVRLKELGREHGKDRMYAGLYTELPEDKKKIFSQRLQETSKQISEYMNGSKGLDSLSSEEQFVIGKLRVAFEKFQKENPSQEFNPKMGKEIDQKVLQNFQYKLAFESFRDVQEKGEKQKADDILTGIQGGGKEESTAMPIENKLVSQVMAGNEKPVDSKNINKGEKANSFEKEANFKEQLNAFFDVLLKDGEFQEVIRKRRKTLATMKNVDEKTINDLEVLSTMDTAKAGTMYNYVHNTGMSLKEVFKDVSDSDTDLFENDGEGLSKKLQEIVGQNSKMEFITDEQHSKNGQPDQKAFVWFKGERKRMGENPREIRFYINSSPNGTKDVAEYMAKLSNEVSKHGMRLNFKFRKDMTEYDRADTCVAYLYIPEAKNADEKNNSDQWLERIKDLVKQIPQDAVRKQNSFFTEKLADGVSYVEDSRRKSEKSGQSYTSQIGCTISEVCGEFIGQYNQITPDVLEKISQRTAEELKKLNYF